MSRDIPEKEDRDVCAGGQAEILRGDREGSGAFETYADVITVVRPGHCDHTIPRPGRCVR